MPFGLFGLFMLAVTVLFGYLAVRDGRQASAAARALLSLRTTAGECVSHLDGDRYSFAFETPAGRRIVFEAPAVGVHAGDPVRVRYDPADPQGSARFGARDDWHAVQRDGVRAAAFLLVSASFALLLIWALIVLRWES